MDSETCDTETTSLFMVAATGEPEELIHPCGQPDGHAGPHECMFCAVHWHAEATC